MVISSVKACFQYLSFFIFYVSFSFRIILLGKLFYGGGDAFLCMQHILTLTACVLNVDIALNSVYLDAPFKLI